ncbi:hypothetical protein QU40_00165, partial [Staphylococcus aureus]
MEEGRFRGQGAGDRLGRLLERRRAGRAAGIHRLASGHDGEAGEAGRERADRGLAGLAGLPPDQPGNRSAAGEVRPGKLRFLLEAAARPAGDASARQARHRQRQQQSGRRGGPALCEALFPGLVQGRHPEHGDE